MSSKVNKYWQLSKIVLPQHTDHAGVKWHGSYINFLEEARIDALNKVGISYAKLSQKGFEIPVISININYKMSFFHGEKIVLMSQFKMESKIRLNCKTLFLKSNGCTGAEASVELVFVKKDNESIKLIRELPVYVKDTLLLLQDGPKTEINV